MILFFQNLFFSIVYKVFAKFYKNYKIEKIIWNENDDFLKVLEKNFSNINKLLEDNLKINLKKFNYLISSK